MNGKNVKKNRLATFQPAQGNLFKNIKPQIKIPSNNSILIPIPSVNQDSASKKTNSSFITKSLEVEASQRDLKEIKKISVNTKVIASNYNLSLDHTKTRCKIDMKEPVVDSFTIVYNDSNKSSPIREHNHRSVSPISQKTIKPQQKLASYHKMYQKKREYKMESLVNNYKFLINKASEAKNLPQAHEELDLSSIRNGDPYDFQNYMITTSSKGQLNNLNSIPKFSTKEDDLGDEYQTFLDKLKTRVQNEETTRLGDESIPKAIEDFSEELRIKNADQNENPLLAQKLTIGLKLAQKLIKFLQYENHFLKNELELSGNTPIEKDLEDQSNQFKEIISTYSGYIDKILENKEYEQES